VKLLKDILYNVNIIAVNGNTGVSIDSIVFDSRQANKDSAFVAIRGAVSDGHDFISQAIESGCTTIIADKSITVPSSVNLIIVENTTKALAIIANNFYDEPSKDLKLIGVTGTNGKTTITTLLFEVFTKLGYKCGLLSTVVNKIGSEEIPSTHTTPDPVSLNSLLRQMVDDGVTHCFIEVSSHAIHQHRIGGLHFVGGAFTNITHDHLDYHETFKEYLRVKKSFFDELPKEAFALVNSDDRNGEVMLQNTKAKKRSYALRNIADYKAKILENQFTGLLLLINGIELWTKLIGSFNAYNLLAVYGIAQEMGEESGETLRIISELEPVDGRFQHTISESGITAIVDYAHTPDALENVLKTIDNIRTRNETVYTVIGCGGDRDKTKRPVMAEIACKLSDKVILTSDNPRSEEPDDIIEEMMEGVDAASFKKTLSITDREQAIKTAVSMAEPMDIILVAGKGHEKYQEIKGVKHDFDDKQTINELFTKLNK